MKPTSTAPTPSAPVPLCDIQAQYRGLKDEIDAAVLRVLGSGQAILGPEVAAFEQEAAAFCGARYGIGCGSGTDALVLALRALGIGPGDEVIVPPFTFFASASAVARIGAKPVFVDVDPLTFNIDPNQIEAKITPHTRAIMPVHLFGQCCDMDAIGEIASDHRLYMVEDAAQSFGSEYKGKRCGTLGAVACMSFYPTKNLGALGDAGLVTTDDPDIDKRLRALRVHGSEVKYYHKYVGYNMRLDAVHAAVLRVKLPHVAGWLVAREEAAKRYDALIEGANLHGFMRRPVAMPDRRHTFNQYVVRVPAHHRDPLVKHLKDNSVGVEVYYPLSLHQQECFKYLGYRTGDFPTSEQSTGEVVALPIFPEITEAQQERVVEVCSAYLRQAVRRAA
ncbi:DegT/DnrJ/EryC1/StrS family aminotransferase [Gemmata sp. JC717]|uniref:DegT/DnrJ/EryC1/StrS family aminotransferase n=1 Tax=Gemmata algarum TaxID=2975278 RepID=A0ABU5FAR6_9BACT|nr:DegT/DnrJ/EryC1/StrS family aminotransferase [Gemmata algarum]MDY3553093.1 DegT/DnrJ/EryC1/StrS family aminotransferase [Gemmata algarum]MDY3563807.1 DegT/DnrJ/EryC1/StrS family aminotransferase [Gemmata algarum]